MRINPNQGVEPLPETSRSSVQSQASPASNNYANNPLGEDQAQLSGAHLQVQALAAQAAQLSEIRQEKVSALRQAILGGNYHPAVEQVADALFAHMLAGSTA
jgi:flagellar biosynthesis anti-sigma factor FlgM